MIRIYTIEDCPYCAELKTLLIKENIEFTEINVNLPEHEEEYNKISEIAKSDMVPLILIKNQILVPNVSFQSITESYQIIKQILL